MKRVLENVKAPEIETSSSEPMSRRKIIGTAAASVAAATAVGLTARRAEAFNGNWDGLRVFSDVASAKARQDLEEGDLVLTRGYFSPGDGGGGFYTAAPDGSAVDNGSIHATDTNGIELRLLSDDSVPVELFGVRASAVDDNAESNSTAISAAISFASSQGLKLTCAVRTCYTFDRITIDSGICFDGNYATFRKSDAALDGFIQITSSDVTIRNLALDGNAGGQSTTSPGAPGYIYPYFGGEGFYATGTAINIPEDRENGPRIGGIVIENMTFFNWGKSAINATVSDITIRNIRGYRMDGHLIGLVAPDRTNDHEDLDYIHVNIDTVDAKNCATVFDLSAPVKDDIRYYGRANINNVHAYECYTRTKVSGAWSLNASNLLFDRCGENPVTGQCTYSVNIDNQITLGVNLSNISIMNSKHVGLGVRNANVSNYYSRNNGFAILSHGCNVANLTIDNDQSFDCGRALIQSVESRFAGVRIIGAYLNETTYTTADYYVHLDNSSISGLRIENCQIGNRRLISAYNHVALSDVVIGQSVSGSAAYSQFATLIGDAAFLLISNSDLSGWPKIDASHNGAYIRRVSDSQQAAIINTAGAHETSEGGRPVICQRFTGDAFLFYGTGGLRVANANPTAFDDGRPL